MSENKYLHVLMISASSAHRKRARQKFQELNLSDGQPKVLSILLSMEGCLQKDLAEACHVEPATMTSLLRKMISDGLIRKEQSYVSGGKRAYNIYFTEKGLELAHKVNSITAEIEEVAFDGFTPDERNTFLELFSRINDNLEIK